MKLSLRSALVCAVFLATVATADAPYFQGLGFLTHGEPTSIAHGISFDGRVVVGDTSNGDGFNSQGFYWTRDAGMKSIGDLDGGVINSRCAGVSADGKAIVGGVWNKDGFEAYRWTAEEKFQLLGDLPGGANGSQGMGVSPDGGTVAGYSSSERSGSENIEAFRWNESEGMTTLGDWTGGWAHIAGGVSRSGDVIVGQTLVKESGAQEAFRWTQDGGLEGLGFLKGGRYSTARAVTPDGSVIVGYSSTFDTGSRGTIGFRWTEKDGMVPLVSIKKHHGTTMHAMDVSDDGSIIVGRFDWIRTSFIWDEEHGVRRLDDVLRKEHGLGDALKGWKLEYASTISGDGSTIAGWGFSPSGRSEAWVAHLPEPASSTLLLALCALFPRIRKARSCKPG